MTEQEIKDGAPGEATHYFKYENKIYYLKLVNGIWLVWYNYDSGSGWGIANQTVVNENLGKA